jgi:hypothetical protein
MAKERKLSDLEILEDLKERLYQAIINNDAQQKVGDLLKIMDMKNKLTVSGKAEKKFWDLINKIREEELSAKSRQPCQPPDRSKRSPA